jgi:hypothetical protein
MNLFRDLRGAKGLRQSLGYIFLTPGWKPEAVEDQLKPVQEKKDVSP